MQGPFDDIDEASIPSRALRQTSTSGHQTDGTPYQNEWPKLSMLTPRNPQQAVVTLELNPCDHDRGLRQQAGRRRRAQARAAAYARWHHGPAPAAPRPLPAALPEPRPTTMDGEAFSHPLEIR